MKPKVQNNLPTRSTLRVGHPGRHTGFTLIELLVVITIIGVLAALISPVIQKSLERSQEALLSSNLRQVGVALLSYASDHNATLPMAGSTIPYSAEQDPQTPLAWQQALDAYINADRRVFLFPNDPPVNSNVQPVRNVRGFFIGVRAAYVDSQQEFAALNLLRIRQPSSYVLGGEVRYGPFTKADADRDNYNMDPAFSGRTTPGEPVSLLFADGSVRRYTHFDQSEITTRYDGPGLADPEW